MTESLKIAFAQINPTVGDVAGNRDKILAARAEAAATGADLVVASEMCLSGYPAEDLVLKPMFLDAVRDAVEALAAATADGGPGLIVGGPWLGDGGSDGQASEGALGSLRGRVYNTAFLLDGGALQTRRAKRELPNYGVFDEVRIFGAGPLPGPVSFRGLRIGLMVCEDMWTGEVAECLEESGAEILVVPNGSPYETGQDWTSACSSPSPG